VHQFDATNPLQEISMNAEQIKAKLTVLGFHIVSVRQIKYGLHLHLDCGAVVMVFDNGAVLVKGKWHPECPEDLRTRLKRALPRQTRWNMQSAYPNDDALSE
jgi:hypothetical protein